jgi:hypothetical protein
VLPWPVLCPCVVNRLAISQIIQQVLKIPRVIPASTSAPARCLNRFPSHNNCSTVFRMFSRPSPWDILTGLLRECQSSTRSRDFLPIDLINVTLLILNSGVVIFIFRLYSWPQSSINFSKYSACEVTSQSASRITFDAGSHVIGGSPTGTGVYALVLDAHVIKPDCCLST